MMVSAVKIGYRLFDTADDYRGESGFGLGLRKLVSVGMRREDVFLQTKISDNNAHADEPLIAVYFNENSSFMKRHTAAEVVREKVAISLREMNTSYIDSLLIHYPYPGYYVDIWKEMIRLKAEGVVRYIGVSNFHRRHIEELITATGVAPEINESYFCPICTKSDLVEYCKSIGCQLMTYSPLMDMASRRIPLEILTPIAEKYHKSVAQIILRWNVERGCIPLPRTRNPVRLAENFSVLDFALTSDEVSDISSLNRNFLYLVESKICPGV